MARIENVKKVIETLKSKALSLVGAEGSKVSVLVGYTAAYALFVHENMEPKTLGQGIPRKSGLGVYWGPHGKPKFLEGPFRRLKNQINDMIKAGLKRKIGLSQSLILAGLRVQRESQQEVPVEYGNLRASAFTRKEDKK